MWNRLQFPHLASAPPSPPPPPKKTLPLSAVAVQKARMSRDHAYAHNLESSREGITSFWLLSSKSANGTSSQSHLYVVIHFKCQPFQKYSILAETVKWNLFKDTIRELQCQHHRVSNNIQLHESQNGTKTVVWRANEPCFQQLRSCC